MLCSWGKCATVKSMDIAFEAALTGHFVMSSLHTNNCFETVRDSDSVASNRMY